MLPSARSIRLHALALLIAASCSSEPRSPRPPPAHEPSAPAPQGPAIRQDHVDRQAVEPGAEGALTAEGPESLPRPDEDVLGQFLGTPLIALQPEAEGMDPRRMGAVQLLECAGVTLLGAADGEVAHGADGTRLVREAG